MQGSRFVSPGMVPVSPGLFDPRKPGVAWPEPADNPLVPYTIGVGETAPPRAPAPAAAPAAEVSRRMKPPPNVQGESFLRSPLFSQIGGVLGAWHGYVRHGGFQGAVIWAIAGYCVPAVTVPVAVYQGLPFHSRAGQRLAGR